VSYNLRILRTCAAVLTLLLAACGSSSYDVFPGPHGRALQELTADVILPAYRNLTIQADLLAKRAAALQATPDAETFAATQEAWRDARAAWKQTAAFGIGPAESLRTPSKIDFWPIRPDRIESEIAGTAALTPMYVDELGANIKGFLALEYLLFDETVDSAEVLERLVLEPRRRDLIWALAVNLHDETVELRDAWEPGAGNFAAELENAWSGSATFYGVKPAMDLLVNHMIFLSEEIADVELLGPLGTRTGGQPRPDLIVTRRSDNAEADLLNQLDSLTVTYFGTGPYRTADYSLSAVVASRSQDVNGSISAALRETQRAVSTIPQPFEGAIVAAPEVVSRAQQRAKTLMRHLEIDFVSALGSTLRFNPSDGD